MTRSNSSQRPVIAGSIAEVGLIPLPPMRILALSILFSVFTSSLANAGDPPIPSGGVSLIKGESLSAFHLSGDRALVAPFQVVPVSGQSFTQAMRIQTLAKTPEPYTLQASAVSAIPVRVGDVLFCQFSLRGLASKAETGEGHTELAIEQGAPEYRKLVLFSGGAGSEWRTFSMPVVATRELLGGNEVAPGKLNILFRVGYGLQTIEIGGIQILNFGNKVKVSDLPQARADYMGREENAAWRIAANERIEKIRKADMRVVVKDAAGKPVEGAEVTVNMQRHAFGFGSAVAGVAILAKTADGEKYRETILKYFNKVVIENDLKWPCWEGNRQRAIDGVKWLRDHDIAVRGHNLVWPNWELLPKDLVRLKSDPAAMRKRINDHILEECGAMRGQLVEWDVINEVYANHVLVDILGKDCLAEWFRLAHQADPTAKLYINDYGTAEDGGRNEQHTQAYYETIKDMLASGAPLSGIGLQAHFGWDLPAPALVLQGLDRFATLGLDLEITEHDIDITDEQAQADYTHDFMTLAFSHPAVTGFLSWGFWEGMHWKPTGAYFRKDWSIKPAGQAWIDLVTKKWWTQTSGKTDAAGVYQTRGFLGDYEVVVRKGARVKTIRVPLTKAATPLVVTLE